MQFSIKTLFLASFIFIGGFGRYLGVYGSMTFSVLDIWTSFFIFAPLFIFLTFLRTKLRILLCNMHNNRFCSHMFFMFASYEDTPIFIFLIDDWNLFYLLMSLLMTIFFAEWYNSGPDNPKPPKKGNDTTAAASTTTNTRTPGSSPVPYLSGDAPPPLPTGTSPSPYTLPASATAPAAPTQPLPPSAKAVLNGITR